jgi:hypothetical protein
MCILISQCTIKPESSKYSDATANFSCLSVSSFDAENVILLYGFIDSALKTLKMLFIPKEILTLSPLAKEILSCCFLKPL